MDWAFRAIHPLIFSFPQCFLMVFLLVGACDAPPRFSFAELKEDYLYNRTYSTFDVVEYRCRPGYMRNFRARNTYVCERNRWKGSNNFCLRELTSDFG
uniref:Sushi domain-containing protein n=1 Tax=Coturnix japonica TaxID=93934 RepID=A0A8C2TTR5_COTJA